MTEKAPAPSTFDGVASGYDDRFSSQPIAKHLRQKIYKHVRPTLPENGRVFEFGCGTGVDAIYFAGRGHDVMATDASPRMLEITAQKAANAPDVGQVTTLRWDADQTLDAGVYAQAPFDIIFSNFGAVNCVADLGHLSRQLAPLLAPDGTCFLVIMNRWCLLEVVLNALLLNRKNMTRRFRAKSVSTLEDGNTLEIFFPSTQAITRDFAPHFDLVSRTPIGVFLPPSELYGSFQKRPRLLKVAKLLDRTLGNIWPFSRWSDHTLLTFQRTTVQTDLARSV